MVGSCFSSGVFRVQPVGEFAATSVSSPAIRQGHSGRDCYPPMVFQAAGHGRYHNGESLHPAQATGSTSIGLGSKKDEERLGSSLIN